MRRSPSALLSLAAAIGAVVPSVGGPRFPSTWRTPPTPRPEVRPEVERAIIAKAKARRAMRNAKRLKAKANGGCN